MKTLRSALLLCAAVCTFGCTNESPLATKPERPVAVIDGPETASPLDVVLFDGSASHSDQSEIVEWSWTVSSSPSGSHAELTPDATNPKLAVFRIDIAGDYEITLKVTDDRGMNDTDRWRFSAVPWQTVHVELTWDRDDTDVDLHLVSETEGGTFHTEPFDCFYENTNPDWGVPGVTVDDPAIDIDDVDGYGPENVSLNDPKDGYRYKVSAHYYDDRGAGSSTVTVRIYLSGLLRYEGIHPLERTGSGWDVATIDWPTGGVVGIDQPFFFTP